MDKLINYLQMETIRLRERRMTLPPTAPSWEQRLLAFSQDESCTSREAHVPGPLKVVDRALHEAIKTCEAITAEYSHSFYLATSLLPREKRRAVRVLYAFCRTADNLIDGKVDQPAARLLELRAALGGHGKLADDTVLVAWSRVQAHYQIPMCYAEQLFDGVELDLVQRRYRTFDELSVYCYGVASTVGLMSMYITGYSDQRAIPYAIKLGVALQLTNILRDVREDWNARRLYLPLDELATFGLDEQDVAAGQVDYRWRTFMRFQIARARRLYRESMPGIALLHPDGRVAVTAAAMLYEGILTDIEAHDYDVFSRRAFVSHSRKLALLLNAFWRTKKLTLKGSSFPED